VKLGAEVASFLIVAGMDDTRRTLLGAVGAALVATDSPLRGIVGVVLLTVAWYARP
jgi:hypothetical protein